MQRTPNHTEQNYHYLAPKVVKINSWQHSGTKLYHYNFRPIMRCENIISSNLSEAYPKHTNGSTCMACYQTWLVIKPSRGVAMFFPHYMIIWVQILQEDGIVCSVYSITTSDCIYLAMYSQIKSYFSSQLDQPCSLYRPADSCITAKSKGVMQMGSNCRKHTACPCLSLKHGLKKYVLILRHK